jgi:hypothetical protein
LSRDKALSLVADTTVHQRLFADQTVIVYDLSKPLMLNSENLHEIVSNSRVLCTIGDGGNSADVKPVDVKLDDVKPADVKPDDAKPDDVKPDDVKGLSFVSAQWIANAFRVDVWFYGTSEEDVVRHVHTTLTRYVDHGVAPDDVIFFVLHVQMHMDCHKLSELLKPVFLTDSPFQCFTLGVSNQPLVSTYFTSYWRHPDNQGTYINSIPILAHECI